MTYFSTRIDAGKRLAAALADFKGNNGLVLSIPRGGVVVGYEIAETLGLPLDVIIPRKLGAPNNPELAIGAIAEDGTTFLDDDLVKYFGVSPDYIKDESDLQKKEIQRRLKLYRQAYSEHQIKGRDVIVVDDGIATGYTMRAALASIKNRGATSLTVAVPVGPSSTILELKQIADRVVCLYIPEYFQAIGQFFQNFNQVSDEEVIQLLNKNRQHREKEVTEV